MPQPISYNPGTPVSGSIQENNISYVVDGQQRNYRGGFGGLSWMSEVPAENNVIFIGNSTSLGRGPANIPLFYPAYNTSQANIVYAANTLPGSPRNFTTSASAYNWAVANNFFINNSDNPIPRINGDSLGLYIDANQPSSYPQTGTSWYDLSGIGNNSALYNGPTWNSNGYIQFDGTDDFVGVGNTGVTKLNQNYQTLRFLTYITSVGPNGYAELYAVFNANRTGIKWQDNGIGMDANGDFYNVFVNVSNAYSQWMDITCVIDRVSNIFKVYKNGTYTGQDTFTGYTANSTSITVGANNLTGNGGDYIKGSISEISVYGKELSLAEIKQNYFQSNIITDGLVLIADASNLVSYPKSGTVAYNLTGSLTGSLLNGVGFSQENGGNWTFDGVDDRISFQSPFGDIDWGTTAFTVMGWIKVDSPNDNDWCLLSSATNSNLIFGTLPYPAGNSLYVYGLRNSLGSPNNQVFNFFASNLWPNGYYRDTWLHVTLTYNGNGLSLGNFAIYSNGVSRTLNNGGSAGYSNVNVIQLGRSTYGTGPTEYPNLIVYNRALTPTEVAQNYEATKYKFQGQQIVTNGLVLNLDSANKDSYPGTGTTWYDLSGNGNNGTLVNGPSFLPNVNSGIIKFDGVDDYVDGGTSTLSSGNISLFQWVKMDSLSSTGWNITFTKWLSSVDFHFAIKSGTPRLNLYTTSNSDLYANTALATGVWYYVGFTLVNGGTLTFYVNGTSDGTYGSVSRTPSNDTIYIGDPRPNYGLAGSIPITQVYNRTLSATEVAQNYNATKGRFGL